MAHARDVPPFAAERGCDLDVGARFGKEAREALVEHAAERSLAVAVAELDEAGTVTVANAALLRLAGRPLVGSPIADVVAPAQRAALDEVLRGGRGGWDERLLGLFPGAQGVPLDFMVSLRRIAGGWVFIAEPAEALVRGVNERLLELNDELARAQRQIRGQNAALTRQNARLREVDQLKDALLANVSHDLRTPLTAILGYAELMRRRGGLTDKQATAAAVIERNARRLLRLVDDLLLLAQARAGALRLERSAVDLSVLVREALELAAPLAAQASLDVDARVPPEGEAVVEADRLRLGQLLDNLIANAIKFTPPGGHVHVGVTRHSDAVALEVGDDGPGIPAEEQDRLYGAFARGSNVDAPGTGLGLAIVRAVADAHGAEIELETAQGAGTRFTIRLPA